MTGPKLMIPRRKMGAPFHLFVSILLVTLLSHCISLKAEEGGVATGNGVKGD